LDGCGASTAGIEDSEVGGKAWEGECEGVDADEESKGLGVVGDASLYGSKCRDN